MKRKYVAVGIILLFVGASLTPAIVQSRDSPSLPTILSAQKTDMGLSILPGRGFALDSIIQLSWNASETEEPLEPGGAPRSINITVTYHILVSTFIGKFILRYCLLTHQYVTVSLGIGDIPSWCTASLSNHELRYLITGNESSQLITLTVAVDEHAPAYGLCRVPIHASVDTLHGPFGFLPFINEYNLTSFLYFQPGYFAHIVVIPENDSMAVIPNESSYLRIFITNAGNARTVVSGSIVRTPPGDWITMITDQIMLDVNMTSVAYLFVVPPVNFNGTDTIIISFTPYKADDQSQHGEPVYVLIRVIYEP
jgi:hypothetical protein